MEGHIWQGTQNNFESLAPDQKPETLAVEQPGCNCKEEMKHIVDIYDIDGHPYTGDLAKLALIDWAYSYDPEPPTLGEYIALYIEGVPRPVVLAADCKACLTAMLRDISTRHRRVIGTPP